jgi:hypothetical protein
MNNTNSIRDKILELHNRIGTTDDPNAALDAIKEIINLLRYERRNWSDLAEMLRVRLALELGVVDPQKNPIIRRIIAAYAMVGGANSSNERLKAIETTKQAINKKNWADLTEMLRQAFAWRNIGPDQAVSAPVAGIPALEMAHWVISEFVYLKTVHEYIAAALWVFHTYVFREFLYTPRLAALSPAGGSGKSTFFGTLKELIYPVHRYVSLTTAALRRLVDGGGTVLIDEFDNAQLDDPTFRAILNANRSEDRTGHVERNEVVSPTAYAPIGYGANSAALALPTRTVDRSIIINLYRAPRGHEPRKLNDLNAAADLHTVRRAIADWVPHAPAKINRHPEMPPELGRGHLRNNWLPLIAIADTFGEEWAHVRARRLSR